MLTFCFSKACMKMKVKIFTFLIPVGIRFPALEGQREVLDEDRPAGEQVAQSLPGSLLCS